MSNELQNVLIEYAWHLNAAGVALIVFTRWLSNTKFSWAGIGVILLIIAIGNASIILGAGLNPSQTVAAIFGLGVHGSLGTRFVGNWLIDGAT